ncbi:hypothetical protein ZIOFF_010073 [Zingiber officinale]|uniref:ABC transporter domain-containing protein n=1 Tax=Zingiber officinale TaxID=94328 RepID=A0A8J5HIQ0_ZINOF|nr:hypothetical protein ZIOFF_010073 [Zingiber officinale]
MSHVLGALLASSPLLAQAWTRCLRANAGSTNFIIDRSDDAVFVAFSGTQATASPSGLGRGFFKPVSLYSGTHELFTPLGRALWEDSNPYVVPMAMGIYKQPQSPLGITTSTIIKRIVANHEAYQKRNEKKEASERKYLQKRSGCDYCDSIKVQSYNFSLVQGLGLDFTYGIAIRSCALQLWVGRFLISNRKANGGEIITALFAIILSSLGLNQAAINFYSFEQGRIVAYKLFEMISCSNSSLNQDGSTLATMQGNIEFRNVYFSYLSRPEILILSGFYQNVPTRKIVALVDIKHLKLEWLRSQIGLVTQEPTLLSLSIKDNIAYGRFATSDQIEEATKTIHAHDFITSLEMGYETQVGRTGLTLTEEQKIKISIARVVLSNPSILLLDEVTSGLDFEAEKVVQEALDILMLGRSTIKIARRLSLILLYI